MILRDKNIRKYRVFIIIVIFFCKIVGIIIEYDFLFLFYFWIGVIFVLIYINYY